MTYVYCIKLPGFETSLYQQPVPSFPRQQQEVIALLSSATSVGQRLVDEHSYTMVKIGKSTNPASRLYEIMRGLEGLSAPGTHFSKIRENDSPDNTVEKGRLEDKVVFIKKCGDIESAERDIRELLGIDCGQSQGFQDQFKGSIGDDKKRYIGQVGMTEWVLMANDLMKSIQDQYRQNWSSNFFQRRHYDSSSSTFVRQMQSFYFTAFKPMRIITSVSRNINIEFPPTEFTYTYKPPSTPLILEPFLQKQGLRD